VCKRAIFNPDWSDHVDLCKKLKGPKSFGGMSVIATI
jgi:hypothetical protein